MHVLCDTCSIIMLLRIAPNMFSDERYKCVTIVQVRQEIVRTRKFKYKYSWLNNNAKEIKILKISKLEANKKDQYLTLINQYINVGDMNYGLSTVDKEIAACSLANGYNLVTSDTKLGVFLKKFFDKEVIEPLSLLNDWLRKGCFTWSDELQEIIKDWSYCNEKPQAKDEKELFESLTGYKYEGP
ncbi:MAG: hypothetical protein L3V56_13950 [Candidatus Magnetoovum sp. WYHC-5]|nr:hypothetical protein [Candidatus Magnetoovum sp. WYHC-5]